MTISAALLLLASQELRPQTAEGLSYRVSVSMSAHVIMEREDRSHDEPQVTERLFTREESYSVTVGQAARGWAQWIDARCTAATLDTQGTDVTARGPQPLEHLNQEFGVRFNPDGTSAVLRSDGTPAVGLEHVGMWENTAALLPPGPVQVGGTWSVDPVRVGWVQALVGERETQAAQFREGQDFTCTFRGVQETGGRQLAEIGLEGNFQLSTENEGTGTLQMTGTMFFDMTTGRPASLFWTGELTLNRPLIQYETIVDTQQDVPIRSGEIRIRTQQLEGRVEFQY